MKEAFDTDAARRASVNKISWGELANYKKRGGLK